MTRYIAVHYADDFPPDLRFDSVEGMWLAVMPTTRALEADMIVIQPSDPLRFERRDDGAAAEVWEVRLADATP